MYITVITPAAKPVGGGADSYMYSLIKHLRENGHNVRLICYDTTDNRKFNLGNAFFVKLPRIGPLKIVLFSIIVTLYIFFHKRKGDVFIYDVSRGLLVPILLRITGKKAIGISHGIYWYYIKTNLDYSKRYNLRYPLWKRIYHITVFLFEYFDMLSSKEVIVKSESIKRAWSDLPFINGNKIKVIPYAIERPSKIENPYTLLGVPKKPYVVYLGHLDYFRGINEVIEIMKKIKVQNVNLLIVGDGPLMNLLQNEAKKWKGPGNLIVYGKISDPKKLEAAYQIGKVALIPYGSSTNFRFMVRGIPVISRLLPTKSTSPINDKLFKEGIFYSDKEQAINELNTLLNDRKYYSKISKRMIRLSKEHIWDQVISLFEEVIKN